MQRFDSAQELQRVGRDLKLIVLDVCSQRRHQTAVIATTTSSIATATISSKILEKNVQLPTRGVEAHAVALLHVVGVDGHERARLERAAADEAAGEAGEAGDGEEASVAARDAEEHLDLRAFLLE